MYCVVTLWMLNFPDFIPEKDQDLEYRYGPEKNASPAAIPSYQLQFPCRKAETW
ncbi:MAG: hypothetical protein IPP31_09855 [Chitinophagaceae bacterium]|nr:hypothetical protein [Chitinophagaceae bacterium]